MFFEANRVKCHVGRMTSDKTPRAWIVPVRTARLGGGQPMTVCYIAGYSEASDAREAVRQFIEASEGDDIGEPSPIYDKTADALDVRQGSVWML